MSKIGKKIIMEKKIISKNQKLLFNSPPIKIESNKKYTVEVQVTGIKGSVGSIYLTAIILGKSSREIKRYIRWIDDFSGKINRYSMTFSTPEKSDQCIIGYRANTETPVKMDLELEFENMSSYQIKDVSDNVSEQFDNISDYKAPSLQLSEDEEKRLEAKLVWIMGSPRTGSTWLATQLLNQQNNIIWDEPYIGRHIAARPIEKKSKNHQQFFSVEHELNWIPALRKLILIRAYSHAQTLTQNIIIKEPNGSRGANRIMKILPNSKLIFLVRDGRDVVDSLLDAVRPDSWASFGKLNFKSLETQSGRRKWIKTFSEEWLINTETTLHAFEEHPNQNRILVKYEELRKNTFYELKKIYQFLNMKVDESNIHEIIDQFDFNNIPESQKGLGKFNRLATPGKWKDKFSKDEIDFMNSIFGHVLQKSGYEI